MKLPVGELLIVGFRGPTIPEWLRKFAKEFGLGGVILFDRDYHTKSYDNNIQNPTQLKALCTEIKQLPSCPLIFIDQEGGLVRRLKDSRGFQPFPSQKKMATLSVSERQSIWLRVFSELKQLGVAFNLAPVIDIDFNPLNPDIGGIERSFSAQPSVVRENALMMNSIAKSAGVGLCLKHFPGLGGATTNSHLELTDISDSLSDVQLELFYELVPQMVGQAVLLSHGMVTQWDSELPVSVSEPAIAKLRSRYPEALLISDDVQMQALQVKMGSGESFVKGVLAGLDMVIIGNNLLDEQNALASFAECLQTVVSQSPAAEERVVGALKCVASRKQLFNKV